MSHYKTIQALGTPHVTHQGIVAMLDDFELAVMLSHLMYWADKTDNPLGIYRSNADWYELFRFKEAKAKKLSDELQKRGLITKTHKRLEHRIYYLFNADEFDRQYEQFANPKNDSSPIAKTKIGEAQKSRLADGENQDSLYTKIYTKNTYKDYSKESVYAPTHATHADDLQNPQTKPPSQTPEVDTADPPPAKQPASKPNAKPKLSYQPPEGLTPTDKQRARCQQLGVSADDELEKFLDWALANAKGYVDWSRGFSTWVGNIGQFGRHTPAEVRKPNRLERLAALSREMGDEFGAFEPQPAGVLIHG